MIYQYNSFHIEIDMEVIIIQEFHMLEGVNQHTEVKLKGILQEVDKESLPLLEKQKLVIKDQDGKVFFKGIVLFMEIKKESLFYQFQLSASSFTYEMDQEKRRRVFQNLDMTYEDIVKEVLNHYKNTSYIDTVTKRKRIPHMIIQYDETDWEFLIRLVSCFQEGICVNNYSDSIQLLFGFPKDDTKKIIGELEKRKLNLLEKQESIRIKTSKRYEIGNTAKYKETIYYIRNVELILDREELIYQIEIVKNKESAFPYHPNFHIAGARIGAITKAVERNRIKLQFQIEDNANGNTPFFPYAGEVNNEVGFYMPEPGNEIEVYFPNTEEESALVISARRCIKETSSDSDSSMKYMRNKEGMELYMDKAKVRLMNGDANTSIELKSNGMISINACETIYLENGSNLELGSRTGKVIMNADNGICMNAGTVLKSKILLEETGNITCKSAGHILYKKNEVAGGIKSQEDNKNIGKKNMKGADKIRGAVMALSGVEFLSQTVTGSIDFQAAPKIVNHLLGQSNSGKENTNHSKGNLMKEKLFQNDEHLFHSFSYGENKNG